MTFSSQGFLDNYPPKHCTLGHLSLRKSCFSFFFFQICFLEAGETVGNSLELETLLSILTDVWVFREFIALQFGVSQPWPEAEQPRFPKHAATAFSGSMIGQLSPVLASHWSKMAARSPLPTCDLYPTECFICKRKSHIF